MLGAQADALTNTEDTARRETLPAINANINTLRRDAPHLFDWIWSHCNYAFINIIG